MSPSPTGTAEPTAQAYDLYGLYARRTTRSKGHLITVMFNYQAAKLQAKVLCEQKQYAAVDVLPLPDGAPWPDSIK